jgi:hypothetical protein
MPQTCCRPVVTLPIKDWYRTLNFRYCEKTGLKNVSFLKNKFAFRWRIYTLIPVFLTFSLKWLMLLTFGLRDSLTA